MAARVAAFGVIVATVTGFMATLISLAEDVPGWVVAVVAGTMVTVGYLGAVASNVNGTHVNGRPPGS